jgi:SAM-dependent methyltransferase
VTSSAETALSEAVICPLCGDLASPLHSLAHTTAWACERPSCGLRFAAPQAGSDDLDQAYRSLYYPDASSVGSPHFEDTPRELLEDLLRSLVEDRSVDENARLLDFGCGRGALGAVARELGLEAVGIERDPRARSTASRDGMQVFESTDDLVAREPGARFDVITLWQVIEHLREPWTELVALRKLLTAGGRLVVATPNSACLKAKLQGADWENFANPTHLYYFTGASLRSVLGSSGFQNVERLRLASAYPHHGPLRRGVQRLLRSRDLDGDILFVARPGQELETS